MEGGENKGMKRSLTVIALSFYLMFAAVPAALAHGGDNSGPGNHHDNNNHMQKKHMRHFKNFNFRVGDVQNQATVTIKNVVKDVKGDVTINNMVKVFQINQFFSQLNH